MSNNFTVSTCRFHTKEKDRLLIVGYFDNDDIDKNHFDVQLDQETISCEIEEKGRLMSNQKSSTGKYISKDYFLWIDLPNDWRKAKKLQVFNNNDEKKQLAFVIKVSKMCKMEKKLFMHIDNGTDIGTGFILKGWYVNVGNANVHVYNETGEKLKVDIKNKRRADVARAFPENTVDEIIGFEIVYNKQTTNRIRVCLRTQDGDMNCKVCLKEANVEKIFRKAKQLFYKMKKYYQQFGVRATFLRIIDKITGRDSITYNAWFKRHCPSKAMLDKQKQHEFVFQPQISIVVPLYKTPRKYLDELIESVKVQTYANWELCLSDGSGKDSSLTTVLKEYEVKDKRIKVVYNKHALQISENTNAAIEIATGDFIAFADHDDLLAPNALYECVYELNQDQSIDVLYTDEDKIDMSGKDHFMPHFKSDFNIDMLRCVNYICHLFVVRRDVLQYVGNLDNKFDGAQDYDFVLRCVEAATNIKHISKILYHWRAHRDSTAENPESKNYAFEAGVRAIQAHYDRVGIKATVEQTTQKGSYRSKYILQSEPLLSIVIPNKDHILDLEKCISSIEEKSNYKNYEIIIVENNSTEVETFKYYKNLEEKCPRAKVVYWEGEGFNYPSINNFGVRQAKGEYILFLNNDTEIVNEDCLEELLGYCMREDVGAVGARLYYEDGTIQHAGVIVGLGGIAGHTFVGYPHDAMGYFGRIQIAQNYSAVTAACMMVKKSVFDQVQGFDERYAVAFNDVDLCMKIRKAGYLIVYNPYAELNHYESKSRGYEDTEEKVQRFNSEIMLFKSRWSEFLEKGDPYYSPNLTLDKCDFSLNNQMNKIRES